LGDAFGCEAGHTPGTGFLRETAFMELTDYIAEDLRGRIRSGVGLPCTASLPALAKHYGVSLTPVRGAIAQLLADGCIEKLPNGRLALVLGKKKAPQNFCPAQPPPTIQDWDRILIREVMVASLQRGPARLREEALAEKHQVGRSVIRQSLSRLAGAGLVEHIPRRGWIVHPIQEDDVVAFLDVREVLELKALDLARSHVCPADLVPMLEGNAPVDEGQLPRLDNRLHDYLIAKSRNRYIRNFFRQYTATYYTSAFDYAAPGAHVVTEMAAQHRDILEALMGRQWARAREALALHIRAQRPVLAQLLHFTIAGKPG
jgi:DNA-binding GntR family transcriptional regulator